LPKYSLSGSSVCPKQKSWSITDAEGAYKKHMPSYKIIPNYSLKELTTIKTGGRTQYFAKVSNIAEIKELIQFARESLLPFLIIGNGSNILFSDEDFCGIVISLNGKLKDIVFDDKNSTVTAGAGAPLMKLGFDIARRGFLGCAYMAVIPGTVGGAVRINAGTLEEGDIKDHFLSALVLNPTTGVICEYDKDSMRFAYRNSVLARSRKIILQATFKLPQQDRLYSKEAQKIVSELLAVRKAKQPVNQKNFGSTFKRPLPGKPPGWYLEQAGMKGMRVGGAMVAQEHANWIVNVDNATSSDVKKLIEIGQKRVFEKFGIWLEREVIYLPEDMEDWHD